MKKYLALLILPLLLTSCGSTNSVTIIELAKKELSFEEADFNFDSLTSMPSYVDSHKYYTKDKKTIDFLFGKMSKIKLVYDESFDYEDFFFYPISDTSQHFYVSFHSSTPKKAISFDLFYDGLVTFSPNAKDFYLIEEKNPSLFTEIGEIVRYGGIAK